MIDGERLQQIADVEISPELFCSIEAKVVDREVARRPHEFFENARGKFGDVIEVRERLIDGVAFPTLLPMNPDHPYFLVLGMGTIKTVLMDQPSYFQNYGGTMDILMGEGQIAGLNPPRHKPLRGLIMQAFNKQSVDQLDTDYIIPIMDALIDKIAQKKTSDLVADFTCRVPTLVICEIFGFPKDQIGRFAQLATDLMSASIDWEKAAQASSELGEMFEALIEERKVEPGHDLISNMLAAELEGERLTKHEMITFCRALVPAGIETTTRALSTALGTALATPDCRSSLASDPGLINDTVEEVLRWNGPIMIIPKRTTKEIELAAVTLPKDANLWICIGHANRDPSEWDNPHQFDFRRERKPHVMFSMGAHLCIGNQLARREMANALRLMTSRFPNMALDPNGAAPEVLGVQFRSIDRIDVITGT